MLVEEQSTTILKDCLLMGLLMVFFSIFYDALTSWGPAGQQESAPLRAN